MIPLFACLAHADSLLLHIHRHLLIRDFVNRFYPNLKSANPNLPILIRECSAVQPRVWLRMEYGRETSLDASNKTADEVVKELLDLAAKKQ